MATTVQVVIDCADPARLARFWATALDYIVQPPPDGFGSWEDALRAWGVPESEFNSASAVIDPDGVGPRVYFQRVPETKVVKNRVHLDVRVGGERGSPVEERKAAISAAVSRLEGEGASRVRAVDERDEYWMVMADPEGNEFCLV